MKVIADHNAFMELVNSSFYTQTRDQAGGSQGGALGAPATPPLLEKQKNTLFFILYKVNRKITSIQDNIIMIPLLLVWLGASNDIMAM